MVTSWSETQMNDGLLFWYSGGCGQLFWSRVGIFGLPKVVQTKCLTAWRLLILVLVHQSPLWHFPITALYMTAPSLKLWYKWTDWKGNIIGSDNKASFSTNGKKSWSKALLTPTAKAHGLRRLPPHFYQLTYFTLSGQFGEGRWRLEKCVNVQHSR